MDAKQLQKRYARRIELPSASKIDWTTPLRSQQADFIKRLRTAHLLYCETEGQHSELTIVSVERTKQMRDFCWRMAEKYKHNSPVRQIFINNMKGKLGEEVVKARLADLVTEIDYEKRLGGDGKVDFRLIAAPSIGIQVKARHGSIDSVRWWISQEELEKNAALICILIQEEVNEAQPKYNLISAGFLPSCMIEVSNGRASVGISELLYSGGLRSYLMQANISLENEDIELVEIPVDSRKKIDSQITLQSYQQEVPSDLISKDVEVDVESWNFAEILNKLNEKADYYLEVGDDSDQRDIIELQFYSSIKTVDDDAMYEDPAYIVLENGEIEQLRFKYDNIFCLEEDWKSIRFDF
jgi:hypothetical protein